MNNDELRLREEEIELIKYKIEQYKEKINEMEIKKKRHLKIEDITFDVTLACAVLEIILLCYLKLNLISFDINNMIIASGIIASLVIGTSFPHAFYIEKIEKTIKKLNTELNENNELLLTRTNYLNELKNKSNEKENEYTNYKYKIINNSDSLTEVKTSGKTRIRKRDK